MQTRARWFTHLALCIVAFAIFVPQPVAAQSYRNPYGSKVQVPPPTEQGDWAGTWFYVSRDARFALWIRDDKDGRPEVKVQYFGMQNSESFITDWQGQADYFLRSTPATFSLSLTERDENVIKGDWNWVVEGNSSARTENASITLHRTGEGRRLVLLFDDFDLVVRRGSEVQRSSTRLTYTFAKVSKRLVRWEELPF